MENVQNKENKKSFRAWLREQAPRLFALCWLVGGIAIALFVCFGVTSYSGERVNFSNAVTWILNEEAEQLRLNATKAFLAILYFVYLIRILKQIWKSIGAFVLVWKKDGAVQERAAAFSEVHVCFAKICGLAVMHMLWARLLTSTYTMAEGFGIFLVAVLMLLGTGVLSNYVQKESVSLPYVLVDALRNLLAILIVATLLFSLNLSAAEKIYDGVLYVVDYIDRGAASATLKPTLYVVYDRIVYPILHIVLLFTVASMIKTIWGNMKYYAQKKEREQLSRKFERVFAFGVVLIVLYLFSNAMFLDVEMQVSLSAALGQFLPVILLSIAGGCLLHFSYPEKHVEKAPREYAEASDEALEEGEAEEAAPCEKIETEQ